MRSALTDGPILVFPDEAAEKRSRVLLRCAGAAGPLYDGREERRFEYVPLWGILVFLAYRMRRVNCKRCGVTVEMVPWCDGKNQLTTTYRWYLATWAKRLSWGAVVSLVRTSWDSVCRAVECGPNGALEHLRPESGDGPGSGRDRLGPGAHVFDALVRHRRRDEAAVGRGRGAERSKSAAKLPWRVSAIRSAWEWGAVCSDMLEAVPQRDRRDARPSGSMS